MDFFTIRIKIDAVESGNRLAAYLQEASFGVHTNQAQINMDDAHDGTLEITVSLSALADEPEPDQKEQIIDWISLGLARYIVDIKEEEIVTRILTREYDLESEEEMQEVKALSLRLLEPSEDNYKARALRISGVHEALGLYLQNNAFLHLDGFITFRLKDYEKKLRDTVEYAIDEYLLDKQYEEFISLLQYFVYFQEPLTPLVHLMHKQGNEFAILNEQFSKIHASPPGEVVARIADQEMEMEDVVVSTLISLSPDRILIHTRDPEAQVISTIRRIFGERVEICLHCPRCKQFHQEARRLDQGI